MYMVAYGNFVNKEFSIVIIIFTCKSLATTLPVYISENESRLTKEGPYQKMFPNNAFQENKYSFLS